MASLLIYIEYSMADRLSAITGLPLDQANALLDSHDGDINAAAEAHFNLNNGITPSADDSPEEVVSQLTEDQLH